MRENGRVNFLPLHRCHDYPALLRAWKAVARAARMNLRILCDAGEQEVIWLETCAAVEGAPSVYLSAGVHGDEAGATSGLLEWAQGNVERLRDEAFLLFPCLNPIGLMLNTRVDGRGLDLNRRFHLESDPVCGAWRRVMATRMLRLGICLHEDYDAQGCYVYELSRHPRGWSRPMLELAANATLPVDRRRSIDGRAAQDGVIQRKHPPQGLPGLPEAVALYELGCQVSLTFETPSEFALDDRVAAHHRFVDAVLDRI